MILMMTMTEAVSFALGAASILLGLLAIGLSIHFYTRDQALFVETQRTLGDIQYTARSVEHATEQVLTKAIDYLTSRPPTGEGEERLGDAVNREIARALRTTADGHATADLTPEALEELRRAVERLVAEHEERRRVHDASDAFWKGTLSETQEALTALRAHDGETGGDEQRGRPATS